MEVNTKTQMLDMFLDRTAGEFYSEGRLSTEETDSGNVALIAYGWLKLSEYNESRDTVTIFTGHKSIGSKTVNKYLNDVVRRATSRNRRTVLSGESPTTDTPNEGVKFINNYISMTGKRSAVEADARAQVSDDLAHIRA